MKNTFRYLLKYYKYLVWKLLHAYALIFVSRILEVGKEFVTVT